MSSSDPFQYFDLDRKTASPSDVKRAYAKRLKVTRPEDDPAAFMTLRSMLEAALNQIKWRDEYASDEEDFEDEEDDWDEEDEGEQDVSGIPPFLSRDTEDTHDENAPPSEEGAEQSETPDPSSIESFQEPDGNPAPDIDLPPSNGADWGEPQDDPWAIDPETENTSEDDNRPAPQPQQPFFLTDAERVRAAIDDVKDLLKSPAARSKWENWTHILDREAFDGLDVFQLLSSELRTFICVHTGMTKQGAEARLPADIPADFLIKLDDRFGWSHQTRQDWYSRDQNVWISRLINIAETATGRTTMANQGKKTWGSANKTRQTIQTDRMGIGSAVWLVFWIIIRLAILLALLRVIADLFD